jgi:hypothetical protein
MVVRNINLSKVPQLLFEATTDRISKEAKFVLNIRCFFEGAESFCQRAISSTNTITLRRERRAELKREEGSQK